jgi:hypothetical protein
LGWILLITQKEESGRFRNDWKKVYAILRKIPDLDSSLLSGNLQNKGYACLRKVEEAVEYRILMVNYFNNPARKEAITRAIWIKAVKEFLSQERNFVGQMRNLAKKHGRIRMRDMLRISNKTIADFHRSMMLYDGDMGLILDKGRRKDQLVFIHNPGKLNPKAIIFPFCKE